MLSWPQPSMNGPASDHGEVLKRTIPCARCRAASPTINGRRRSQGRAPASLRYSEIKSPTKQICSTGRIALHLGSRMVSVIDSATLAPRPLPAMWSVRKCWPA